MSAFRFLHAADLHLGSPLGALSAKDPSIAARFAAAGREAFEDLVGRAIDEKVAFAVIAGDVYDGDWRDASIGLFFARQLARLDRAGVPVILLKGNHDAASVVTKSVTLPEQVMQFPTRKAETFRLEGLKVALHGQSFADRAVPENLALAYPPPVPGWFNVGVLHTSCEGSAQHQTYAPCTVQELALRGYDYWALGHVHEHAVLSRDPWIVFPGNLQGRSVRECGPRGAVIVDVADGHVTEMRRLIVDRARWASIEIDLTDAEAPPEVYARAEAAAAGIADEAEGRLVALRIRLTGATPLHAALNADPRRLTEEIQAAAHRRHEDIWVESVRIGTRPPARAAGGLELKSLDLDAMLDGLAGDPEVRARAGDILRQVTQKLPAGAAPEGEALGDDLDALLAEARALVVGRAEA